VDAAPTPLAVWSQTDWFPFDSCISFELANFVFTEAELPRKEIDHLLELWAATLVPHGVPLPIADHKDLLRQIDSIPLRNVPWECFSLSYNEPLPETTRQPDTGDKGQFTRPVHCKYITRKWTMYLGYTHLVHPKYIQNFPCQCSCNFPGLGNSQDIHSVPGHMTAVFPLCN